MLKINSTQLFTAVVAAVAAWFIVNKVIPNVSGNGDDAMSDTQ